MNLYEIAAEYQNFLDAVENGEVPEEAINDTLESIDALFEEKADAIACMIKNCKAEVEAIKTEANKLTERARKKQKTAESMTEYLLNNMLAWGKKKLETSRNVLTVAKKPDSVVITDETALYTLRPDLFVVDAPKPSKSAIGALLKAGETLQGCELSGGYRLAVK